MTDRELLEQAARAAGIRHIEYTNDYDGSMGLMRHDEFGNHTSVWNPLTDDGDALRLAVKLGIKDYFSVEVQTALVQVTAFEPREHCEYEECKTQDPYAATRRAIVRAAAEIGKDMK